MSFNEDVAVEKNFNFWHDREIRFDGPAKTLEMRGSEEILIRSIPRVEDTKGNNGMVGTMLLTNLRLIWYSNLKSGTNLSIGYYTIKNITVKDADSKLSGGVVSSLYVTAKFGTNRFQFVFTSAAVNEKAGKGPKSFVPRENLFSLAHMAWRAYESSKPYREVRLRSAITANNGRQLVLLPQEKIRSQHNHFMNLTKDESFVGRLILTNVRLVWIEDARPAFNVSVPYIQIIGLRLQTSQSIAHKTKKKDKPQKSSFTNTGSTLVVQSSTYGGSFKFGFCAIQSDQTAAIFAELRSLWEIGLAHPILGVAVEALKDNSENASRASSGAPPTRSPPPAPTSAPPASRAGSRLSADTPPVVPHTRGASSSRPSTAQGEGVLLPEAEGSPGMLFEEAPRDGFAAYYADDHHGAGTKTSDRTPVYDMQLGLAVERLKKGVTMADLWGVSVK